MEVRQHDEAVWGMRNDLELILLLERQVIDRRAALSTNSLAPE